MDYQEFIELFEPVQDKLYFLILSIVKNADDADDVFQDVALRGCVNFNKLRNRGSFMPWITKIAVNASYDQIRKRRDKVDISTLSLPHYDTYSEGDEALRDALMQLRDAERTVVILRALHELTFKEIAGIVHRPENTVRTVYARALKKLSAILDEKGGII